MNKLTITITITESYALSWFSERTTEEIVESIIDAPEWWLDGAEIEVVKEVGDVSLCNHAV